MKRYGDNLPSSCISEEEIANEHGRNVRVMYGGCGVRFGTFSKPVEYPRKRKPLDLLSFLGFKRNKTKKETDESFATHNREKLLSDIGVAQII